ncbi:MAG: hypothetical protein ACF8XB_10195 [Planctomycetota bacterium JB042]
MHLLPPCLLALALALSPAALAGPHADFGRLPLLFEENRGAFDPSVRYVARAPGSTLFLTGDAAVLALDGPEGRRAAVFTRFVGARTAPPIVGVEAAITRVHRYRGNDPSGWFEDVPTFRRVRVESLWDGIDLELYDRGGALEYDFVVAPGADPSRVRMRFDGIDGMSVRGDGALVLATPFGELTHSAPILYQETVAGRTPVTGRFVATGAAEVGFAVDAYDEARPLVIDPVLVFAPPKRAA